MTTISNTNGYELQVNGKGTNFMVIYYTADRSEYTIYGVVTTLRKANNLLKNVLTQSGVC